MIKIVDGLYSCKYGIYLNNNLKFKLIIKSNEIIKDFEVIGKDIYFVTISSDLRLITSNEIILSNVKKISSFQNRIILLLGYHFYF